MAGTQELQKRKGTGSMPAPTLAELQERFQDAIMNGGDAILDLIPDNSRTTGLVLFGVYRHAYVSRLVGVLGNDHPILSRYLGEDRFAEAARGYLAKHPSHNPNARWFSHDLPQFLASNPPYCSRVELGEIAQLERALNDAFDAPDGALLELAELSRYAPEMWGDLRFVPHPSAVRLEFKTNAYEIWQTLKDGGSPPQATMLPHDARFIVWRHGVMPMVRALGAEEAMLWDEAVRGARFSLLCELAATYTDPDGAALRAAQYLQSWITAGLLSTARIAPRQRRRQTGELPA